MPSVYIYIEGYSESTEPIDAVNILPLARFEPTNSATPPSTTPDINATNCATESSPIKDDQEALILMTTYAVHIYCSKAMMFVKLYFRTSDIYLISLVSLDPSGFHLRTK